MIWMPVNLLVILAVPAGIVLAAPAQNRTSILITIGIAYGIAALIVIAQAAAPGNPPEEPDPVRATQARERREMHMLDLAGYSAAAAVAGLSCLIAVASTVWAFSLILIAAAWVIAWWPRAMRQFTLTSTIVIARDPATVFAFVSDQRNGPRYYYMYDETVEKIGDEPIGVGTQFRSHLVIRPDVAPALKAERTADGIDEIVTYEPNTRLAMRTSTGLSPNLATFDFEEVPGGTRLTHRFAVLHGYATGVLGAMILNGPTNASMRANRERVWLRAKEILENETP